MFGVLGIAADGRLDLLIHHDVNLDPTLGGTLQHPVESPFLVFMRGTSEEQFRRYPPIGEKDGLGRSLQRDGDGVEVVAAIDIPFDVVAVTLRCEALKAMTLGDLGSFGVGGLFMWFVVAVVG